MCVLIGCVLRGQTFYKRFSCAIVIHSVFADTYLSRMEGGGWRGIDGVGLRGLIDGVG